MICWGRGMISRTLEEGFGPNWAGERLRVMTLAAQDRIQAGGAVEDASPNRLLIALFIVSLVMPFFFFLGGLRLSVYRLYLLVFAVLFFVRWVNGSAGKIRAPDILVITASLWMMMAMFMMMMVMMMVMMLMVMMIDE